MRKARWLADWRNSENKPVFYHCISRIVDRRFVLGAVEKTEARIGRSGAVETMTQRKGMSAAEVKCEKERAGELSAGRMLRCRVRYFTDGAVIGSKTRGR